MISAVSSSHARYCLYVFGGFDVRQQAVLVRFELEERESPGTLHLREHLELRGVVRHQEHVARVPGHRVEADPGFAGHLAAVRLEPVPERFELLRRLGGSRHELPRLGLREVLRRQSGPLLIVFFDEFQLPTLGVVAAAGVLQRGVGEERHHLRQIAASLLQDLVGGGQRLKDRLRALAAVWHYVATHVTAPREMPSYVADRRIHVEAGIARRGSPDLERELQRVQLGSEQEVIDPVVDGPVRGGGCVEPLPDSGQVRFLPRHRGRVVLDVSRAPR